MPAADPVSTRARLAAAHLPAIVFGFGVLRHRWLSDDGLIYVNVAEHLASGGGPTFSSLLRVESATGPLWLVLVAALDPLPGDLGSAAVVTAGLAAVSGMVLACRVAARLGPVTDGPVLAVALLGLAFWPLAWDFGTSGLEMGLVLLWLADGMRRLIRIHDDGRLRIADAVSFGLGPLLRPDLALFSAAFLVSVLRVGSRRLRSRWWAYIGAAAVLPVAWQVFRSGYYASLVPAAGTAKEAGRLRIDQGVRYVVSSLADGVVLCGALLAVIAQRLASPDGGKPAESRPSVKETRRVALFAGAAHLVYVVAIGGDFMRGRLLLPGLFVLAIGIGTSPVRMVGTQRTVLAVGTAALALAAVAATRSPAPQANGIHDERAFYVALAGVSHPTGASDFDESLWVRDVEHALEATASGSLLLFVNDTTWSHGRERPEGAFVALPLAPEYVDDHDRIVVAVNLGIPGIALGPSAPLLDVIGLADPVAAHQRLVQRGRPGHEKALAAEWYVARFADPEVDLPDGIDAARVEAARRALGCGELADLVEATTAPMDLERFLDNLRLAPSLTTFRFDPDPLVAERELCGP